MLYKCGERMEPCRTPCFRKNLFDLQPRYDTFALPDLYSDDITVTML